MIDHRTSQNERILSHLQHGGAITTLSAIHDFGCVKLGSRISELRKAGHPIADEWIRTHSGKRVKRYFIGGKGACNE